MVNMKDDLIEGLLLIETKVFNDHRGFFKETFRQNRLDEILGLKRQFVQDNESLSRKGVIRGLHFQTYPHCQAKLVRVASGRAFDVAVDLRPDSPTFGRWNAFELSAENGLAFYIPEGFAHGFMALSDNTALSYKVTDYYAPECDGGIFWNDPQVGVDWPVAEIEPVISEKDKSLPRLSELGRIRWA